MTPGLDHGYDSSSEPDCKENRRERSLVGCAPQTANFVLQGHVVTLEITSGVVYRGKLLEGMSHAGQYIFFTSILVPLKACNSTQHGHLTD